MPKEHIVALDGLRGVAALIVVLSHFTGLLKGAIFGGYLGAGAGQIGVMIFFVLSGFLMGAIYLGQKPAAANMLHFAQRRIARVIPLFLLVLLVSVALQAILPGYLWRYGMYVVLPEELFTYLTFRGYGPVLWTIAVEVQFYVLFPMIWAAAAMGGRYWRVVPPLILAAIILSPSMSLAQQTGLKILGPVLVYFMAGAAFAVLTPMAQKLPRLVWDALFFASSLGVLLLYPKIYSEVFSVSLPANIGGFMWSSMTYLAVIAALVWSASQSRIAEVALGLPVMAWLGQISYSVYLLHMPVLWYLNRFTPLTDYPWLFFPTGIGTVLCVSHLSFKYFEAPSRRWLSSMTVTPQTQISRRSFQA